MLVARLTQPVVVLLLLSCLCVNLSSSSSTPGEEDKEDWNDKAIAWRTGEDWSGALDIAEKEGKPLMLLIHRKWCGACKSLRPKFAASDEIAALSSQLVMVKSQVESEFAGVEFEPDGGYVPRVLFFDSRGTLLKEVARNEDKHRYFHFAPESIVQSMKKAVEINRDLGAKPKSEEL